MPCSCTKMSTPKELQRQVGVQESRRLYAAVDGTLGIKGDTGLADDDIQKHREARNKHNTKLVKAKGRESPGARSPKVIAVDPGTTVFVETLAWEFAIGGRPLDNTGAGKWTIVRLPALGLHVILRSPVDK